MRKLFRQLAGQDGQDPGGLPSVAGLLGNLARLKRTIFLVEFTLLAALFGFEILHQYRATQTHERDIVTSYIDDVETKSRILIGMSWQDLEVAARSGEGAKETASQAPWQSMLEVEGYATVSLVLGGALLGHADDGSGDSFMPEEIFPDMSEPVWGESTLRNGRSTPSRVVTGWFWHNGSPYLATAGPVPVKLDGVPGQPGAPIPLLVLTTRFDAARLQAIAKHFDLPELSASPVDGDDGNNGVSLRDSRGRPIGELVWETRIDDAFRLVELSLVVAALAVGLFLIGRYMVRRVTAVGLAVDRINQANMKEKAHLRSLIEASNDGLVVLDATGIILDCNETVSRRTGVAKSEVVGANICTFLPELPLDDQEFLDGDKTVRCRIERRDGTVFWLDVGCGRFADEDSKERYIVVARDVTQRVEAEEAVWHKAHFDTLTDLPNRALFNTRLNGELMRAREEGTQCVLMFVDLDGFKAVNDTFGHEAGDALLQTVADRFRELMPAEAMVARLGGDEFSVILPTGVDLEAAIALAGTLGQGLSQPHDLADGSIRVSASVGIAQAPRDGQTASELLRAADKAMYSAKRKAPGGYALAGEGGKNGGYRAVKRYS
ncbi:diguanylate cyclase [Breoghania sp. JC706]|uniref:diguanylate cyclase domain-containing protein n=1 Tax=Breoghania sp. JC706 TaxID=3117732 RepID=UPI003009A22C